jgi:hypothetical protein
LDGIDIEMEFESDKNILKREYILNPNRIRNSGLSNSQVEFMYDTLHSVFGDILIPRDSIIRGNNDIDIPVTWMLIDETANSYKELYELSVELSMCKSIPNHEPVFQRLKNAKSYSGARAEVHIGAWAKTATTEVRYIEPSKKEASIDLNLKIDDQELFIEIKGSDETDFEVGLNMFEGWLRSKLIGLFPNDNKKRIVKVGGYWIDAIGAACSMKPDIENASWAFHSTIDTLAGQLAFNIDNLYLHHNRIAIPKEAEVEIEIVDQLGIDELLVVIELPQANRIALIGNIVKKLTDSRTINQIIRKNSIVSFYTQKRVDEILARLIIGNLLMQCPPLRNNLLGVAIFDNESKNPILIHGYKLEDEEWNQKSEKYLRIAFKRPNYYGTPT